MRFSKMLIPTLKESPADAEVVSHKLMLRGGYIRKLASGIYSYLPLGLAAIRKVEKIVQEEMNLAGAQELLLPMVQPSDLWKESGRWQKYGAELLRFTDRHDRESCLGPTHEEVITDLVRKNLHSYRDLPINLYQIQTKFRDEIRPRFGLMRGREFIMKDGYSFDATESGAEETYKKMNVAYHKIFSRCGLKFRAVDADSGSIGGSFSHEFMVLADTGEDTIVTCRNCSYAANMEMAQAAISPSDNAEMKDLAKIDTPGKRQVVAVCDFLNITPDKLVKTLIYIVDGTPVAVLLRGDHEVQEVKLQNLLNADEIRLADDKEVFDATGVPTGYLGPAGLGIKKLADQEVGRMCNFAIGANEKNYHMLNANLERDFEIDAIGDIRTVTEQDLCPKCDGPLVLTKGIEVGHIFKLGTSYSEALKATFLDSQGEEKYFIMGCYGIGVSRIVAAAIEQNHDKDGMIFPMPIAPFQVIILNLSTKDEDITNAAEALYQKCLDNGIEAIIDDRDERPGIKFKDADLIGIPLRVNVGKNFSKDGQVEIKIRSTGETLSFSAEDAPEKIKSLVGEALHIDNL
jgi:prolyl-tRNA synthetase